MNFTIWKLSRIIFAYGRLSSTTATKPEAISLTAMRYGSILNNGDEMARVLDNMGWFKMVGMVRAGEGK
jgi:hypothetical protein